MGQICTVIDLYPFHRFDLASFGTHIGTRPYDRGELDPLSARSNCFGGTLKLRPKPGFGYILCCERCGLELTGGLRSKESMHAMWALMTCQAAFMEGISADVCDLNSREIKFLPNQNKIVNVEVMGDNTQCIRWQNWMQCGSDLAVRVPLGWSVSKETVYKLGAAAIEVVASLAAIHAHVVDEAAQRQKSAFGWLYQE